MITRKSCHVSRCVAVLPTSTNIVKRDHVYQLIVAKSHCVTSCVTACPTQHMMWRAFGVEPEVF